MTCFIRSAARADIERQFRYYLLEQDAPEIALRWLDAVQATVETLGSRPRIGAPHSLPNLPNLRSWPVSGFDDIRIYYMEMQDTVRVIRILHGKRDLKSILKCEDARAE